MIFITISSVWGQEVKTTSINPEEPGFRLRFSQVSFNGNFSVMAIGDEVNNYYMADFTQLPDKFEKVYFINLVYNSGKIVNIDADIQQDRVWFLANKKYSEKETTETFGQLRDKTLKAANTMTTREKETWMVKNNKFK